MSDRDSIVAPVEKLLVEFRDVPGFPGYRVGSDGSVWSNKSGRWKRLDPCVPPNGYPQVTLQNCDGPRKWLVSRLVLESFVGPPLPGHQACHFPDPCPQNNNLSNLRWGTPKENNGDKQIHGTQPRGEQMPWAKVNSDMARALREEYAATTLTISDLARKHRLNRDLVYGIISGRNWKHVGGPIPTSKEMLSRRPIGVKKS